MAEIVVYGSGRRYIVALLILILATLAGGLLLSFWIYPGQMTNILLVSAVFLLLPVALMFTGAALGRSMKLQLEYNPPEWEFEPLQLKPEECRPLVRKYLSDYEALVSHGHFWFFFTPIVVIISLLGIALFVTLEVPQFAEAMPLIGMTGYLSVLLSSVFLGIKASSNDASEDFTLPLIREAEWVAKTQSKVPAVSYVRVVLEEAKHGKFRIYRTPRVIIRLEGIEEDAYIETRTDELGAISRLMCRLHHPGAENSTIWWWLSRDRFFRKLVPGDETGYYVKNPVPSRVKELGVKDVRLVTENAIAIVLLEWLRIHGENEDVGALLNRLGVGEE